MFPTAARVVGDEHDSSPIAASVCAALALSGDPDRTPNADSTTNPVPTRPCDMMLCPKTEAEMSGSSFGTPSDLGFGSLPLQYSMSANGTLTVKSSHADTLKSRIGSMLTRIVVSLKK